MKTMGNSDKLAPMQGAGEQSGRGPMADWKMLNRMSLEELLYYVLVGDGRRVALGPK
jgi:hypothetical protein